MAEWIVDDNEWVMVGGEHATRHKLIRCKDCMHFYRNWKDLISTYSTMLPCPYNSIDPENYCRFGGEPECDKSRSD